MVKEADTGGCRVINTACVTNTRARAALVHRRQVSDNFSETITSLDLQGFYSFTVPLNIRCIPDRGNRIGRGTEVRNHGRVEESVLGTVG